MNIQETLPLFLHQVERYHLALTQRASQAIQFADRYDMVHTIRLLWKYIEDLPRVILEINELMEDAEIQHVRAQRLQKMVEALQRDLDPEDEARVAAVLAADERQAVRLERDRLAAHHRAVTPMPQGRKVYINKILVTMNGAPPAEPERMKGIKITDTSLEHGVGDRSPRSPQGTEDGEPPKAFDHDLPDETPDDEDDEDE